MIIKVYAWVPRSYVHVAEITNKAMKGLLDLEIKDLNYDNDVYFKVKEFEGYKDISFVLDGDGLYSVSIKLPDGSPEKKAREFYNKGRKLIMDIIKKSHRVTYTQIIEGILPINYSIIVMSKKTTTIKDYEKKTGSGITIYSNKKSNYIKDSFTYLSGRVTPTVESIADYHAFTNILSQYFYEMMNKMEDYHDGTKEVIHLLEYEPNSKLINTAYLNLDLVKKDASESWAKIEQAIDCLLRKKKSFTNTKIPKSLSQFTNQLQIMNDFDKLSADKDYVKSLWELLISHLEYVDTAVEARVNYKSMSAYKAQQWLSIINSGFVLGAILLTLFMLGTNQLNNLTNFIILIVAWILSYEIINFFVIKRKY